MEYSIGDQFEFDGAALSSGLAGLGGASATPADLSIGVNFDSGLPPSSYDDGNGWFVYHTQTGGLEWDASGSNSGGDAVVATQSNYFLLSAGDYIVVDL